MFKNNVKTAVLLAGLGALFLGIGSLFGTGRPHHRAAARIRLRGRFVLVLRQDRGPGRRRQAGHRSRGAAALRDRARADPAGEHADAGRSTSARPPSPTPSRPAATPSTPPWR